MKTPFLLLPLAGMLLALNPLTLDAAPKKGVPAPKPRNVILLIGDGMGVAQVFTAIAIRDQTAFEQFPITGFSKTQSADRFTTDSGAGGTALATGKRTKNHYVSVDPETLAPLPTMLERCRDKGMNTGVVTTCAITEATPAAFLAHNKSRYQYEEIAIDVALSGVSLFIGGGRDYFEKRKDGRNYSDTLRSKGYDVVYAEADLAREHRLPMAALLWPEHPTGANQERGDYLPKAVARALQLLPAPDKGFFMMVEGSQIDWTGHDNNFQNLQAEMLDFEATVRVALEFAKADGNTLVVVTADHETGGLSMLKQYDPQNDPKSPIMTRYTTFDHSAVMVPVFAFGPGAEAFSGIYKNTSVFEKIMTILSAQHTSERAK